MKKTLTYLFIFLSTLIYAQDKLVIKDLGENNFSFLSIDSPLSKIAGAPEPFFSYWWEFGDGHFSTLANPKHRYLEKANYNVLLALTNNYDDGPSRPTKKNNINANQKLSSSLVPKIDYLAQNELLGISKNQDPKPNEEIIFAQTYKNNSAKKQKGILLFFYNQKEFDKDHFVLADYRNHYKEKEIVVTKSIVFEKLSLLENTEGAFSNLMNNNYFETMLAGNSEIEYSTALVASKNENEVKSFNNLKSIEKQVAESFELYRDVIAFEFDALESDAERNLFMSFLTTNDMLKDTNVTINVQSMFIPEDLRLATSVKHFMPIVTAHDPNKLIVNKSKTYRSFSKKNNLEYEIKFQNVGKGPAEEVKLRFYNNADIDIKSIEILEIEPKCEICSENCSGSYLDTSVTKDYVEFHFHNIYLPGTRQTDLESRDASKGFVKFNLQTEKKVKQNNLTCRTEIYFDKEDPIRTNNSKTNFQKRVYFGLEAGAAYLPISIPKAELFLRGTMTLRISNNWHYRAEIGAVYQPVSAEFTSFSDSTFSRVSDFVEVFDSAQAATLVIDYDFDYLSNYTSTETLIKTQSVSLNLVPIQFRRDLNSAISLGFGVNTKLHLLSNTVVENSVFGEQRFLEAVQLKSDLIEEIAQGPDIYEYSVVPVFVTEEFKSDSKESNTNYTLDFASGLFLDVNIGKNYSIPYFGVRANVDYYFSINKINPGLQIYLGANF